MSETKSTKPIDGAKVFIKNKKTGKYLFQLRDNKPHIPNPNVWGSLGGGIEKGEEPIEALKREIREESNIEIYDIEFLGTVKDILVVENKKYPVTVYFFIAYTDYELEQIAIHEGQRVGFFTIEEFEKMDNTASTTTEAAKSFRHKL